MKDEYEKAQKIISEMIDRGERNIFMDEVSITHLDGTKFYTPHGHLMEIKGEAGHITMFVCQPEHTGMISFCKEDVKEVIVKRNNEVTFTYTSPVED